MKKIFTLILILLFCQGALGQIFRTPVVVATDIYTLSIRHSHLIVNGFPAFVYLNSSENLMYVRATNAEGTTWGTPVTLESGFAVDGNYSMALINGKPAVAYSGFESGKRVLKYKSASNNDGSSWNSSITVYEGILKVSVPSLQEIGGVPALIFRTNNSLEYSVATDNTGTTFNTPVLIITGGNIGHIYLKVVNGNPAVVFTAGNESKLQYVRATNSSGSTWGSPVTLENTLGFSNSMEIVNGNPAVTYSTSDDRVKYIRASDASGNTWAEPQSLINSSDGFNSFNSLAVINGFPAIAYINASAKTLHFIRASDINGNAWQSPELLDEGGGFGVSLTAINNKASIAYIDEENSSAKYIQDACVPLASSPGNVTITWTGAINTDWNNPCNWSPAWVPDANSIVKILDASNDPVIASGTALAKQVVVEGSGASLTINSGATLTVSNDVSTTMAITNGILTNNGTLNINTLNPAEYTVPSLSLAGASILNNYGTIAINAAENIGLITNGSSVFTNKTGASLTVNTYSGILLNNSSSITNETGASITGSSGSGVGSSFILQSGQFHNYGTIDMTGNFESYYQVTSLINYACATFKISGDFSVLLNAAMTNNGYIGIGKKLSINGTFTNNGVLKYETISILGSLNNNANSSIIVNNSPTPIFTYGGTYNGTVNGIFTNAEATTSAGTFTAPNTFTPNGNVVYGVQTLYAKITPSGGGCSYIAPFTYALCNLSASISYADTPFCRTAGVSDVTFSGTTGGVFTSTPAGLNINSLSGQITPTSSSARSYIVSYTIAAANGCAAVIATTSLTITEPPSASISYAGSPYCTSSSFSDVMRTGTAGGIFTASPEGLSINSSTGRIIPTSSSIGTYTITYTIAASEGCAAVSTTTSVIIGVPAAPTNISASKTSLCGSGTANLTGTCQTGTITWYTLESGGASFGSGSPISVSPGSTTSYYASCTENACLGTRVFGVTVEVNSIPSSPYSVSVNKTNICSGAEVSLTANCISGTVTWHNQATGGSSIGTGSPLIQNPTVNTGYYASCVSGLCASSRAATNLVQVTSLPANPSGVSASSASICVGSLVVLTANCASGTIIWYNQATGLSSIGTGSPLSRNPTENSTFYASCKSGSCESARVTTGEVSVTSQPNNPTGVHVSTTTICSGNSVSLTASCASGTITWYNQATGGSAIGTGSPLSQSPTITTTYYASCKIEGCESSRVATNEVTVDRVATPTETMTWTGAVSTDWSTPCNWSPTGVPTATNPVLIQSSANNPVISSGTALAKTVSISISGASLTINNGATLTVSSSAETPFYINANTTLTNYGTLNVSNLNPSENSFEALDVGTNATLNNYGTVSLTSPKNNALRVSGSFINKTGASLIFNALLGIINQGLLTNETGASITGSAITYGISSHGGQINNYGLVDIAGLVEIYVIGTIFQNHPCATFKTTRGFFSHTGSTSNNNGYLELYESLHVDGGSTFTNSGLLKSDGIMNTATFNNNVNSSIIVNNSPTPIFTYGGTYNGMVNGIFTNADATISAGTFTAPNTFTPNGNVVVGSQILYAKITPNGNACTYIVPFTYEKCGETASISYAGTPYCKTTGASNVTLTGTPGGTFTSMPGGLTINSSSGQITPAISAAGIYTVTYQIAATGQCAAITATANVTVNSATASISYAGTPYCKTTGASNVTFTGTSGGTFTASPMGLIINSSSGQINPSSSTAGTYTVTYTLAANGECAPLTATTSVTVINSPEASISYAETAFCKTAGVANVTLTGTTGGVFSANPSQGLSMSSSTGQITPGSSSAGTYTITYTIAASGACAAVTATTSVTITNAPSASISYADSPYCKSVGISNVTRTGTPGGIFAAAPEGLNINSSSGQIAPSSSTAGVYTVTYTIAASGPCAAVTATTSVTIVNTPVPGINYAGNPYCKSVGVADVTLTDGSPTGTFTSSPSGLVINNGTGQIYPATSAPGTYKVTYTIAAIPGSCTSATATTNVTITTNPTASISYAGSPYCQTANLSNVTRTGTSGGVFTASPEGLTLSSTTGLINPATSTAGTYTVTYTIAASGGCAAVTATTAVTITNTPGATISYAGTPYCKSTSDANVTLTGTTGGVFSSSSSGLIINPSTGQIFPISSTAGTYVVTYTIAANGGCASATATTSVTITNNPSATISYTGTPYCKSAGASNVTLTGSSGGTFTSSPSGLMINSSSGQITPGSSTAGTYVVTYSIAANGGCASATATTSVTITNNPIATISYAGTPYCKSAGASNVNLTGSSGGTFTSSPVGLILNSSSGQITPNTSTAGTYVVTYTIAANGGCASATATTSVTITTNPSATISYTGSPYCKSAGASNVTLTGSSGGTFTSSPVGLILNSSSGQITPGSSTAGTYTVTYTIAANGGCASATATTSVTISNNPSATISYIGSPYCKSAGASNVTLTGFSGGIFTSSPVGLILNSSSGQITPSSSTAGTYVVTYTIAANGGCASATATTIVTITNNPSATISYAGTPYCKSTGASTVTLTGSSGGTFTSSPVGLILNSSSGQITPGSSTAGTYTVTYTIAANGGCASATATTSVTITNNPSATISYAGTPYCKSAGASNVTLTGSSGGTFTSSPVGLILNSSSGQITPSSSSTAGTYVVTYTIAANGGCASATATTSVTITNNPTASITGVDNLSCSNNSVIRTANGGTTYLWSNGLGTNATATITSPGTYTVTVTGTSGCSATATTQVTAANNLSATASNTGPYGIGQTIQLNATGGGTYTWTGPNNFTSNIANPTIATALIANSGIYTVTVTNNGCSATATTQVIVNGSDPCTQIVDLRYVKAGSPYQPMFSLRDGMNIQYTSELVSIMAVPICSNVSIGSVDLTIVGPNLNWTILQNVEPFTIFDNLANSFNGRELLPGTYTFTITGYPEDNRIGGTIYGPVVTTFTIVGNSAAIGTPIVSNTNLCAGGSMNVSFSTTGSFAGGNEFQVQLSDINGSFVTPTIIGITNTAGNVICQIPQSVSGSGYLIRVVSTNQVIAGNPINTILSVIPSAKTFVNDVNGGIITEQASQKITATQRILSPANVSYLAGKSIELNPGFAANNGVVFKAEIGGCGN